MPPTVVSREEHERLREELLMAEKALTRQRDEVAKLRRSLPWVRVEKEYTFEGIDGSVVKLQDLFREGKKDLIVYHFMYDPQWELPCDHCCCWAEGYNAYLPFLEDKCSFAMVAKAPYRRLKLVMAMKGWSLPMYSSAGSSFNVDFNVENQVAKFEGKELTLSQGPGLSVFRKEDGVVYKTYSTYRRGLEDFNAIWAFLDALPDGRDGWHPKHKHLYRRKRRYSVSLDSAAHKRVKIDSS